MASVCALLIWRCLCSAPKAQGKDEGWTEELINTVYSEKGHRGDKWIKFDTIRQSLVTQQEVE